MKTTSALSNANGISAIARHVERIRELSEDIKTSIAAIAEEFSCISKAIGGTPQAIDALHTEMPFVGLSFWRSIASVAERRLHPLAISSGCTAVRCLASMPIDEQEKALTVGVPVSIGGGDHRLVPAHLLTSHEIKKAISKDGRIRSVSEQVKYERDEAEKYEQYLEESRLKCRQVEAEEPDETESHVRWRATSRGRAIITSTPLVVTEKDLLAILKDMRNAK